MNLVPSFAWLTHLRWQRLRSAAAPDFADMGTAFGLDASLDPEPPTTVPAFFVRSARPADGALDSAGLDRRVERTDPREGESVERRSRL